jgi:hypothetical protein
LPKYKSSPGHRDLDKAVDNAAQKALDGSGPGAYTVEIVVNVDRASADATPEELELNPIRDYIVTLTGP